MFTPTDLYAPTVAHSILSTRFRGSMGNLDEHGLAQAIIEELGTHGLAIVRRSVSDGLLSEHMHLASILAIHEKSGE